MDEVTGFTQRCVAENDDRVVQLRQWQTQPESPEKERAMNRLIEELAVLYV